MNEDELRNELETMRENIKNELAYVNAKHDVLVSELCYLNNLISRAKRGDSNG